MAPATDARHRARHGRLHGAGAGARRAADHAPTSSRSAACSTRCSPARAPSARDRGRDDDGDPARGSARPVDANVTSRRRCAASALSGEASGGAFRVGARSGVRARVVVESSSTSGAALPARRDRRWFRTPSLHVISVPSRVHRRARHRPTNGGIRHRARRPSFVA